MMKRIIIITICIILLISFTFQLEGKEKEEKANRKLLFELSVGVAGINPQELYYRASGIDGMVGQYADYTGADMVIDGEFKKNKLMIPFNLSVIYPLSDKLYIRGGIEYGMSISSSEKGFLMNWPPQSKTNLGGTESQYYSLSYKTTYIMPQIGLGFHVNDSFDVYGTVGLGLTRFTYTEDFSVLVNSAQVLSSNVDYTAKGNTPGFIVGAKYQFPIRRWGSKSTAGIFVKVEYMVLKAGSLTGTRAIGSNGTVEEELRDATFYSFSWDPFGLGTVNYWETFTTEPSDGNIAGAQKMSLNLSCLRLMIGVSF